MTEVIIFKELLYHHQRKVCETCFLHPSLRVPRLVLANTKQFIQEERKTQILCYDKNFEAS